MPISDKCVKTVDVRLDIGKDFAVLQGMIMAGSDWGREWLVKKARGG